MKYGNFAAVPISLDKAIPEDRRQHLKLDRIRLEWNRLNAGILCSGKERGATRCEYR